MKRDWLFQSKATFLACFLLLTVAARGQVRDPNADRDKTRDAWQFPGEVLSELGIQEGHWVADIGAGSGYFSRHLAERVGSRGRVLAVETDAGDLAIIRQYRDLEQLHQLELIQGDYDDPHLPEDRLDAVLIVDTYHEFRQYDAMLERIVAALEPGGRLGIIDGQAPPGKSRQYYHENHVIAAETVLEDAKNHGLEFLRQGRQFHDPDYDKPLYFLIFRKP